MSQRKKCLTLDLGSFRRCCCVYRYYLPYPDLICTSRCNGSPRSSKWSTYWFHLQISHRISWRWICTSFPDIGHLVLCRCWGSDRFFEMHICEPDFFFYHLIPLLTKKKAFARDGAIPGSRLWRRVDKRFDIPLLGLTLSTVIDCLLGCIYFGSTSAFNAFTGVATICLSVSYGIPILVSLIRKRKAVAHSSFSLGKFGFIINLLTVVWIALAIVLFCMPTAIPVTPVTMNYASVVFMGFASISVFWYVVRGRKNFTGPPVPVDVERIDRGKVIDDLGRMTTENGSESPNLADKKGVEVK